MWTAGGAGGSAGGPGFGMPGDVGALTQQYWKALSEAMRSAGSGARPQDPWQVAMDSWSQLAGGARRNDASDMIERFSAQARQWFGMMQQVAGQFAGRSASAQDIAGAWKQAMGGGGNPFASLFTEMTGRGQSGFDQWYQQVAPMFKGMFGGGMFDGNVFANNMFAGMRPGSMFNDGMLNDSMQSMRMPAFGLHREHQERWQALAEAQFELQRKNEAYNALMLEAGRDAFERFERKLAERSEPGRQLQSARALFDLWIDAAEEAYAEIALSSGFRKVYGELVNAQMRVRAGVQREVELFGGLFGMPGRTEVDGAHRKIAELERQLRRLRDAVPVQPVQTKPAPKRPAPEDAEKAVAPGKTGPTPKPAAKAKPAAKKATARKTVAPKPKPSRATAKPTVKRAPRQAIATIAMPEPLKPMPVAKNAKRKR
ncbi:MAG: class III poly(R)-hydroxyalkanoic acid synthase subunit PhaE [Lysobacter sp.]|nr:class III poly(R)-hydroxyalkanoic acid synthase subunit PhaE [Lysobacter sp.]